MDDSYERQLATSLPMSQISVQHASAGPLISLSRIIARASDSADAHAVFKSGNSALPILEQGLCLPDAKLEMSHRDDRVVGNCDELNEHNPHSKQHTPWEAPCFEHENTT